MNNKTCPVCGKAFAVHIDGALTKYCSQCCADEARRIRNRDRWRKQNPGWDERVEKVCEYCGKHFAVPARNAHIARRCSDKCTQTQYTREIRGFGPLEDRRAIWEQQKAETRKRRVKERAARRKANHRVIVCSECGARADVYDPSRKTCSPECSKARQNRLNSQRKDERLNDSNIVDKDISLKTLFKRDKGVCYICGGKCDFKDYIRDGKNFTSGANYPSIDHIIPIARGGKHSWDNVKLAHHLCNAKKSDILPSEFFNYPIEVNVNEAYVLARKISPRKKQVKQFNKDGKLLAIYESTVSASKQTGLNAKGIQNCARGERPSQGGYLWSY